MSETIVRPLPVPSDVAIRSALLALANLGAELQTYNEEARTIVASMPKWFGVKKSSILVRVQDYGDNCRMEIELPDKSKSDELFNQISIYLVDGHRAASDMTMRWTEKQTQGRAFNTGQQVAKALKRFKPGSQEPVESEADVVYDPMAEPDSEAESSEVIVIEPDQADQTEAGFIIPHPESQQVQLQVNPDLFVDRSSYLETCSSCQAVVLRGSQFCGQCGRPVTMEAVSKEVNEGSRNTARSSLIFGGLAIALQLVTLYFLVIGPLINNSNSEEPSSGVPLVNILLAIFLGILPSFLLGNEARRMAKTANIYLKFRFNKDQEGSSVAQLGRNLGWAAIYISVGWVIYLAAQNFL